MNQSTGKWLARATLWQVAVVMAPLALFPAAIRLCLLFPAPAQSLFPDVSVLFAASKLASLILLGVLVIAALGYWLVQTRFLRVVGEELAPDGRVGWFGAWRELIRRYDLWGILLGLVYYGASIAAVVMIFFALSLCLILPAALLWLAAGVVMRRLLLKGARLSRPVRWAAVVLALLPCLTFGAMWASTWFHERRAAQRLEAIFKDDGGFIPFTETERLLPPLVEDGAPFLYEYMEWRKAHPEAGTAIAVWQESVNRDPDAPRAAEVLAAHAEILPVLDRLGEFSQARFQRDWQGEPFATLLPELSALRALAQLQDVRIKTAAGGGDYAEAERLWRQAGNFRSLLARDPPLISGLVAIAMESIRIHGLTDCIVKYGPLPESWLRAVIADAPAVEKQLREMHRRAIHGEIAAFLGTDWTTFLEENKIWMVSLGHGTRDFDPGRSLYDGSATFKNWVVAANTDRYLEIMAGVYAAAGLDFRFAALDGYEAMVMESGEDALLDIVAMMAPAMDRTAAAFSELYARERAVAALAALELYRAKYGQYPDSLAALVPEFLDRVPEDPFNGEALRYAVTEVKAIGKRSGDFPVLLVYSVGKHDRNRDTPHTEDVNFPGVIRILSVK